MMVTSEPRGEYTTMPRALFHPVIAFVVYDVVIQAPIHDVVKLGCCFAR